MKLYRLEEVEIGETLGAGRYIVAPTHGKPAAEVEFIRPVPRSALQMSLRSIRPYLLRRYGSAPAQSDC